MPHTVSEWYVRRVHENLPNENGLPHTVSEWYVRRVHKNILKENGLLHASSRKFHERCTLTPHGLVCGLMAEREERLARRRERDRLRRAQETPEERETRY